MIYRVLVCDDEELHRKILIEKIEKYFSGKEEKYKIIQASSGKDALKINRDININLAFLDIELEDIKGIELSKNLKGLNNNVLIVFVTSHAQFMQEAFNQFAFNYILKPINQEKFESVMIKALEDIKSKNKEDNKKFYNIVYKNKMNSISYDEIIYFEKRINKLIIVLKNRRLEVRKSLKEVEGEINIDTFIRCHKSYIINKTKIIRQQGDFLTLSGSRSEIPIGNKYRKNVMIEISKLIRERRQ